MSDSSSIKAWRVNTRDTTELIQPLLEQNNIQGKVLSAIPVDLDGEGAIDYAVLVEEEEGPKTTYFINGDDRVPQEYQQGTIKIHESLDDQERFATISEEVLALFPFIHLKNKPSNRSEHPDKGPSIGVAPELSYWEMARNSFQRFIYPEPRNQDIEKAQFEVLRKITRTQDPRFFDLLKGITSFDVSASRTNPYSHKTIQAADNALCQMLSHLTMGQLIELGHHLNHRERNTEAYLSKKYGGEVPDDVFTKEMRGHLTWVENQVHDQIRKRQTLSGKPMTGSTHHIAAHRESTFRNLMTTPVMLPTAPLTLIQDGNLLAAPARFVYGINYLVWEFMSPSENQDMGLGLLTDGAYGDHGSQLGGAIGRRLVVGAMLTQPLPKSSSVRTQPTETPVNSFTIHNGGGPRNPGSVPAWARGRTSTPSQVVSTSEPMVAHVRDGSVVRVARMEAGPQLSVVEAVEPPIPAANNNLFFSAKATAEGSSLTPNPWSVLLAGVTLAPTFERIIEAFGVPDLATMEEIKRQQERYRHLEMIRYFQELGTALGQPGLAQYYTEQYLQSQGLTKEAVERSPQVTSGALGATNCTREENIAALEKQLKEADSPEEKNRLKAVLWDVIQEGLSEKTKENLQPRMKEIKELIENKGAVLTGNNEAAAKKVWTEITDALKRAGLSNEELEVLVAFVEWKLPEEIPDEIRTASAVWITRLLKGEDEPRLQLVRSLVLNKRNKKPGVNVALLANCRHLKNVTHLKLRQIRLNNEGAAILAAPGSVFGNVTHLDLSINHIGPNGAAALASKTSVFKNVTQLNLSSNRIRDEGAEALAAPGSVFGSVIHLKLENLFINEDGVAALAAPGSVFGNVTHLDLSQNSMGAEGAALLASPSSVFKKITHLKLDRNSLGNEGILALADEDSVFENVVHLDISRNGITDQGVSGLAGETSIFGKVRWLDLSMNNIGNEGVAVLVEDQSVFGNLTKLILRHTSSSSIATLTLEASGFRRESTESWTFVREIGQQTNNLTDPDPTSPPE